MTAAMAANYQRQQIDQILFNEPWKKFDGVFMTRSVSYQRFQNHEFKDYNPNSEIGKGFIYRTKIVNLTEASQKNSAVRSLLDKGVNQFFVSVRRDGSWSYIYMTDFDYSKHIHPLGMISQPAASTDYLEEMVWMKLKPVKDLIQISDWQAPQNWVNLFQQITQEPYDPNTLTKETLILNLAANFGFLKSKRPIPQISVTDLYFSLFMHASRKRPDPKEMN